MSTTSALSPASPAETAAHQPEGCGAESNSAVGAEVTSAQVGHAVLEQLRELDEVAYLRFASVYKNFDQAADFRRELALLEKN